MVNDYLTQAVAIHRWLEGDRATPQAQRATRDRHIGLQAADPSALSRVQYWWSQITTEPATSAEPMLVTARLWLSVGLWCLGLLVGGALASLAFAYEGRSPINVLALLGVLIGLPTVLLLLTIASAVLRGLGLKPLSASMPALNLNRWILGLLDRYTNIKLSGAFGQRNAQGRLAFWQLTLFSQWFGFGFYLGVLAVFTALLAFTDLAFGWSSTLEIEPASIHRWANLMAAPWASWWPQAVPDMALITGSRIYRIDLAAAALDAGLLRGWWPFIMLTLLTWGLAPRCLLLVFAMWRVRVAARNFLLEHSEVVALLDRMATPVVEPGRSDETVTDGAPAAATPPRTTLPLHQPAVASWNYTLAEAQLTTPVADAVVLTSMQSGSERELAVETLVRLSSEADGVAIFTKGWEPPLLEFKDLLSHLRKSLGQNMSIVVMPMGLADNPLQATDLAVWEAFVSALGDAHTYVVDGHPRTEETH